MSKFAFRGALSVTLLVVLLVAQACVGFSRLEPGWAAVKIDYANGGQRTDIPSGGFLNYNPVTERIAEYPIGQQSLVMVRKPGEGSNVAAAGGDDSVECRDQHGIPVHIDTTVFWRIDPTRIADMFVLRPAVPLVGKTLNDGIDGIVVRRLVRGTMQDQCSPLVYGDIFGANRATYVQSVSKALGCPPLTIIDAATGTVSPAPAVDPLTQQADGTTALGKEFIICDKFQMGEVYLDQAQQDAFSAQATAAQNAITAASQVEVEHQKALALRQTADGAATQVKTAADAAAYATQAQADAAAYATKQAADARAYEIAAQQKALAAAPDVRSYDVSLAAANHPPLVQGSSNSQVQIPLPAASPTPPSR